jgi:Tfp pilus assembly protein PilX
MKLSLSSRPLRRREHGFFLVIVLLALTAILLIYLTVNARRLAVLKQDLRLIEQKQIQRFNSANAAVVGGITNRVPGSPAAVP